MDSKFELKSTEDQNKTHHLRGQNGRWCCFRHEGQFVAGFLPYPLHYNNKNDNINNVVVEQTKNNSY